ncbi:hypothetical protein C8R44DRAFT_887033 [Mycena epipterygia]|nr:hypothetical protein C8R44DRAFT_887033 [Mycena epipterygia]
MLAQHEAPTQPAPPPPSQAASLLPPATAPSSTFCTMNGLHGIGRKAEEFLESYAGNIFRRKFHPAAKSQLDGDLNPHDSKSKKHKRKGKAYAHRSGGVQQTRACSKRSYSHIVISGGETVVVQIAVLRVASGNTWLARPPNPAEPRLADARQWAALAAHGLDPLAAASRHLAGTSGYLWIGGAGRYHAAGAASLALSARLHTISAGEQHEPYPDFPLAEDLLTPQFNQAHETERLEAFWSVTTLNNCWLAAYGCPLAIPPELAIDIPWSSGTQTGATIAKFLDGDDQDGYSPVALVTKASLLCDVMGPSVDRWVKTMTSAEQQRLRGEQEDHVAGVTVSAFTRDLIYRQMMTPLKVSMLANSISTVYLSVSNDYILPAQRSVGNMLQFSDSTSAADKATLIRNLEKSQGDLANLANTQIAAQSFQSSIDARLSTIVKAVQRLTRLCMVPDHIQAITDAHVADMDATKALQAQANPMFDTDSAM